jgi:hypothetical protein
MTEQTGSVTSQQTGGVDRLAEQRAQLRVRHAAALTALMEERADLKGVHALADHFDDAVRWSA